MDRRVAQTPVGGYDHLLAEYFPAEEVENAEKTLLCESDGNPNAIGDGHLAYWKNGIEYGKSYGYMQIRFLPGRPSPDWLLVPENNIKYAAEIYKEQGWRPWSCARKLGIA